MKHKLLALLLALTAMSWAQSTTPNQTLAPEQKSAPADAKPACPCCDKMADHAAMHKDMECCANHKASAKDDKEATSCCSEKDAKGEMSCCGDKDAKACMKKNGTKDDKSSASCPKDKCGEGHEMACCSAKEGSASGCCHGNQCGKHNHEPASPGN
jgi:hypothetical protein